MAWKSIILSMMVLGIICCGCGLDVVKAADTGDQKQGAKPWEHEITDDLHVKKYPGNKVMWDLLTRLAYEMYDDALSEATNLEKWQKQRQIIRKHFLYMLALEHAIKEPVKAVVAAKAEADGYVAEAIVHSTYEGCSGQGLLMYPGKITKPLPLIIWGDNWGMGPGSVSGPLKVGMKWVQDGYAIFFLDTVGHSHHKSVALYGKWWWLSHGQNEPGENVIRYLKAIDYLSTRKEIDPKRIGVFGISGWGACTWYVAALDERVAAAVSALPSTALAKASISSPELGLTEKPEWIRTRKIKANWKGLTASAGGCDQGYFYNCYRYDAAEIKALCTPRAILVIAGLIDDFAQGAPAIHARMKKVWNYYGKQKNLALHEHSGGHNLGPSGKPERDEWFARHLKPTAMTQLKDSPEIVKDLSKALAKWKKTPDSWGNSRKRPDIWSFVKLAQPPKIENAGQWQKYKKKVLADLKEKVFGGFPARKCALNVKRGEEVKENNYVRQDVTFASEQGVRLSARLYRPAKFNRALPALIYISNSYEESGGTLPPELKPLTKDHVILSLDVRGFGITRTGGKYIQWPPDYYISWPWFLQRCASLVGRTFDSMRVWDVTRAVDFLVEQPAVNKKKIRVYGKVAGGLDEVNVPKKEIVGISGPGQKEADLGIVGLYAAVLDSRITRVFLSNPSTTHFKNNRTIYINVMRILNIPQAAALVAPREVTFIGEMPDEFKWSKGIYKILGAENSMRTGDLSE